jgi:hypothetical protein
LLLFNISFGFRGYDTSSGCATFSPSGAEKGLFRRFPTAGEHQLLLLMQQILAFPVSFVDTAQSSVKFGPLYFGGIPLSKLKAQSF